MPDGSALKLANTNEERQFPFSDAQYNLLAQLATSKTGIVLAENKKAMIYGRLVRRLRALRLDGFDAYCKLLQSPAGEEEIGQFVNAVTTNLTRFFREPHHFEHLTEQMKNLAEQGKNKIRIWSAGCSSGMEPYSIAMTLAQIPALNKCDVKILATDLDTGMLDVASAGDYATADVANVPTACHRLLETGADSSRSRMGPELKRMITFNRLNLLEDWPMQGKFDAIFCRNVVIYFDRPTKQVLFDRMAERMLSGGLLYIGHSESLNGISDRYELVGRTIYRRVS